MSSSEDSISSEDNHSSDEDYGPDFRKKSRQIQNRENMNEIKQNLRREGNLKYNQQEDNIFDYNKEDDKVTLKELDKMIEKEIRAKKREQNYQKHFLAPDEAGGVFYPAIDQILWRRSGQFEQEEQILQEEENKVINQANDVLDQNIVQENLNSVVNHFNEIENEIDKKDIESLVRIQTQQEQDREEFEYLVKYKEYSYLHLDWIKRSELENDQTKGMKNKLNRFDKMFNQKILDGSLDDDGIYFDQTYIEVDRVIATPELFPIIHPKKASEIQGKWSELLTQVVLYLLSYSRDGIHYGIYFSEPVKPEEEGIPNYKRIIQTPMDLGTVSNRVYLDHYQNFEQFWNELGLIFKNCRKFTPDLSQDIRILCDTLREVAIEVYKQWYKQQKLKFDKLMTKYVKQKESQINQNNEENDNIAEIQNAQQKQSNIETYEETQINRDSNERNNESNNIQQINEGEVIDDENKISKNNFEIKENIDNQNQTTIKDNMEEEFQQINNNHKSQQQIVYKKFEEVNNETDQKEPKDNFLQIFSDVMDNIIYQMDQFLNQNFNFLELVQSQKYSSHLSLFSKIEEIVQSFLSQNKEMQQILNKQQQELLVRLDYSQINYLQKKDLTSATNIEVLEYYNLIKQYLQKQILQNFKSFEDFQILKKYNENTKQKQKSLDNSSDNQLTFTKIKIKFDPNNIQNKIQSDLQQAREKFSLNREKLKAQIINQQDFLIQETELSLAEIQQFDPGKLNFDWIRDFNSKLDVDFEHPVKLEDHEIQQIDLEKPIDKLYLVKWKNLSYSEATWEHESELTDAAEKINDYRNFNRALDKDGRFYMQNNIQRHKTLFSLHSQGILDGEQHRGKRGLSDSYINDLKNKLFHYTNHIHKFPFEYNQKNQPIYKYKKLLRPYQIESLNWLIQSWYEKRNVILADEMGLGKTIQTIAFLNHLIQFEQVRGPFLIIAPLSTLEHWRRTGTEWTTINCVVYYDQNGIGGRQMCRAYEWFHTDISIKGSVMPSKSLYKFHILITTYEVFLQDQQQVFMNIPFQFIVIDEAHRLKNQNAKLLTCLKRMLCQRILLLTGTPIQNNTEELWTLLNFIEKKNFPSLNEFQNQFGDLSTIEQVQNLHKTLHPFLLRRMKEDVEKSIPPLQETIIDVEMTTIQKTLYRALYERNKYILQKSLTGGQQFQSSLNNLEMQLRKVCNHPFLIKQIEQEMMKNLHTVENRFNQMIKVSSKMILLDKLLNKLKMENKKVLIFSQFVIMLHIIEEYLGYKKIKYEKIDGSTKAKDRQNAIDRFNNPDKKLDVFLLSTKAGGLGINLASASIVIIFDSDWNPQNDVQAIARAHRIGQLQEVLVYRFITRKTYETEMFERATKKLGLDQAIFKGGTYQTVEKSHKNEGNEDEFQEENQEENISNQNSKKMSKAEMELLLKKGILGLFSQNDEEDVSKAFQEKDIDQILEKNTRIAKYSLVGGTYSFSKTQFVSDTVDAKIDVNDPSFWETVLKGQKSQVQSLLDELQNYKEEGKLSDFKIQEELMKKINDQVSSLVYSKMNIEGYSADDEKFLIEILNNVYSLETFYKLYKKIAINWIGEIQKPSRRFKKLTDEELSIENLKKDRKHLLKKQLDNQDLSTNENNNVNSIENDFQYLKATLGNQKIKHKGVLNLKEDRIKRLCQYCERPKCTFFCSGHCGRCFHQKCSTLVQNGEICGLDSNNIKIQITELSIENEEMLNEQITNFICEDCKKEMVYCFYCKKLGCFNPQKINTKAIENKQDINKQEEINEVFSESIKEEKIEANNKSINGEREITNMQVQMEIEFDDDYQTNEQNSFVKKCSTANCPKYYHIECIRKLKNVKFSDGQRTKFRCPLHYCSSCTLSGDAMPLLQCFRCINSYHVKCCNKEQVIRLSKKLIICKEHKKEQIETKKLSKQRDILSYIKEKEQKERITMTSQNARNNEQSQNELQKIQSIKKVKRIPPNPQLNLKKKVIPKITYQEIGIPSPHSVNYETYDKDWCRYCGARIASNFTKGPWGPRTLCTVHYIEWGQKHKLNLSEYKELPKKPINIDSCLELSFISSQKQRNPNFDAKLIFNEPARAKKVKREDIQFIEDSQNIDNFKIKKISNPQQQQIDNQQISQNEF